MSNDDHKKAPQSPEEMLEMIGKVRDPWGREDSPPIKETTEEEREELAQRKWPSGQAKGPETVAREQIDLETMKDAIERFSQPCPVGPPEASIRKARECEIIPGCIHHTPPPPEIPTRDRPIGSPFDLLDTGQLPSSCYRTPEEHEETKGTEDDTENPDPLVDLREKYKELCGDVLPSSGYRTPEEHEAAQDTADSEKDQDRCSGKTTDHTWYSGNGLGKKRTLWQDREATIPVEEHGDPIGYIELDILIEPPTSPEPDADVMGYLHSRYGTEPQMRDFVEMYDVRLSTVRLAFESQDDDQWYYEIDTTNSFDCGYIYGELSDACDHVDQIAREILQDDLTHF